MDDRVDAQIGILVERLAMACVDVEPERCDTDALRLTAHDMLRLADLLDGDAGDDVAPSKLA